MRNPVALPAPTTYENRLRDLVHIINTQGVDGLGRLIFHWNELRGLPWQAMANPGVTSSYVIQEILKLEFPNHIRADDD